MVLAVIKLYSWDLLLSVRIRQVKTVTDVSLDIICTVLASNDLYALPTIKPTVYIIFV